MNYTEIKRHLDKPDAVFVCERLLKGANDVVLRYVNDEPGQVGELVFEAGSITYAYYRQSAGYVLWKMCDADGFLRGHLFHICKDLNVGNRLVEYLDLLLDLWFDAEGKLTVLDREELEAYEKKGTLSRVDLDWIAAQEGMIISGWDRLVARLDALLEGV